MSEVLFISPSGALHPPVMAKMELFLTVVTFHYVAAPGSGGPDQPRTAETTRGCGEYEVWNLNQLIN